jgi:hypothetical protein
MNRPAPWIAVSGLCVATAMWSPISWSQVPTGQPAVTYPATGMPPAPGAAGVPTQDPNAVGSMPVAVPNAYYPAPAPAPPSHPIRQLFANTIMAVLGGMAPMVVNNLTQGVNGSIQGWFDRKHLTPATAGANYASTGVYPGMTSAYPSTTPAYPAATTTYPTYPSTTTAYPSTSPTYPAATTYPGAAPTYPATTTAYPNSTPTYPTATTYPSTTPTYPATSTAYPSTTPTYPTAPTTYPSVTPTYPATATTYPSTTPTYPVATTTYPGTSVTMPATNYPPTPTTSMPGAASMAVTVVDPRTGMASTGATVAAVAPGSAQALVAGVAYEVHALLAGQGEVPVEASTYQFHTGDQFKVYLRPSTPGRLDVYNVNPLGQQSLIDSTTLAAGQLSTLGPYAFAANKGDESLRLVISPCANPQLMASTRDIVNASASAPAASSGINLPQCTTTRGLGIKTRDIQKVAVDGTTSFALDTIAANELSNGQITARSVTIYFHHL